MSPQAEARLKALREAPLDSWIALSEDETRIVAVGKTYAEAAEKSDQAGCADPVIIKTPPEWAPLSFLKPAVGGDAGFPDPAAN
jgi:hypothetical protein